MRGGFAGPRTGRGGGSGQRSPRPASGCSACAHRLGAGLLVALFVFGIYKIVWVHEADAYLFRRSTWSSSR
jgi:hypothetical protein